MNQLEPNEIIITEYLTYIYTIGSWAMGSLTYKNHALPPHRSMSWMYENKKNQYFDGTEWRYI